MYDDADIVAQIPGLRRYARSLLGSAEGADDLVQDCLERALGKWRLFRPGTNLRAWLFTIMHNVFVNQATRRNRSPVMVEVDADADAVALPVAAGQENGLEVADLARRVASLPEDQREVLLLVGMEQMTYREVASVLGIPVGTVMSRLHRGRERLRALMDGNDAPTLRRVK